jgi:DNA adenine methylase
VTTEATKPEMKIGALVPWFGGKRTLAPHIVEELGPHTQYFELFCGSMAVLFAKQTSQKETVNDLHGDLINLARVIQSDAAPVLYERLQQALFCEGLLEDARDRLDDESSLSLIVSHLEPTSPHAIERAYWYFLASWSGRNGTAGTARVDYQLAVRWTKGGGSPTVRFRNALDSLPAWHRRLRNVVILRRDAFAIVDRFEDVAGTAIYLDPPYHIGSRETHARNGRGGLYLHEFNHDAPGSAGMFGESDDHVRLRDALAAYQRARIVVSYYDHPRIRELYDGWTFIEHTTNKQLHQQNGRGKRSKDAPELLIVNGPSYAEAP